MKIIKSKKRRVPIARDQKKESIFKGLSHILLRAGYTVRRERLKQGHGWKVASGSCRVKDDQMVFVDSRLTQDDQNAFLLMRIRELGIDVTEDDIADLPERFQGLVRNAIDTHSEMAVS